MRWAKSIGGLVGGRMRTESSQKLWLLTLSKFAAIHQLLEDRHSSSTDKTADHADLHPKRMEKIFAGLVKSRRMVSADFLGIHCPRKTCVFLFWSSLFK